MRQYYYRETGCKATNADSPDCTCWHTEADRPLPLPADKVTWRDVPPIEKPPVPQDYTRGTSTPVAWQDELNGPDRSVAMNRTTWLLADALGLIEPDANQVTLEIADTVGKALDAINAHRTLSSHVWRCFHCDELFTDRDKARDHFGRTEMAHPACTIDAAQYREMESYVQRAREEDTAAFRCMARMESTHVQALKREEEKGYARGMADLRKESKPIVDALIGLTRDAFYLMDNSEERCANDEPEYVIQQRDYDNTSRTLAVLEALPDDKPGYVLGPAGKAQWALRNLLGDE